MFDIQKDKYPNFPGRFFFGHLLTQLVYLNLLIKIIFRY